MEYNFFFFVISEYKYCTFFILLLFFGVFLEILITLNFFEKKFAIWKPRNPVPPMIIIFSIKRPYSNCFFKKTINIWI